MDLITKKSVAQAIASELCSQYATMHLPDFVNYFDRVVLCKKIKFPLLELIADKLSIVIPFHKQDEFTRGVVTFKRIGSFVIAGKILQNSMENGLKKAVDKAIQYIETGNEWYACDILAERVMGHGLLTQPEEGLKILRELSSHSSTWILRSIGVGIHYAVKKKLQKDFVPACFDLLLMHAQIREFHVKKGIGWAAKTTAKFHADIVKNKMEQHKKEPGKWFLRKINIGLNYHPSGKRN